LSVIDALMVLSAYALIQSGIWRELDEGYLALNIVGVLLLGVVAIADQRVGFIFLEFAWAGLGFVGMVRAIKARRTAETISSITPDSTTRRGNRLCQG
jgi:drug/metabolite transporter (DMT)-like permease